MTDRARHARWRTRGDPERHIPFMAWVRLWLWAIGDLIYRRKG